MVGVEPIQKGALYLVNPEIVDIESLMVEGAEDLDGALFICVHPQPGQSIKDGLLSIDKSEIPQIIASLQELLGESPNGR